MMKKIIVFGFSLVFIMIFSSMSYAKSVYIFATEHSSFEGVEQLDGGQEGNLGFTLEDGSTSGGLSYGIEDKKLKGLTIYGDEKGGNISVILLKINMLDGKFDVLNQFENVSFINGEAVLDLGGTLKKTKTEIWAVLINFDIAEGKTDKPQYYCLKYKTKN